MIVKFTYQINQKENKLVYTTINEHGVKNVKIIPIRDEKGEFTKEFLQEANKKKFKTYYEKVQEAKAKAAEEAKVEEATEVSATKEVVEAAEETKVEETAIVAVTPTKVEKVEGEIIEPENTELMIPETKVAVLEYKEAPEELKKKRKFSFKRFAIITGLFVAGLIGISRFEGCSTDKEDTKISSTVTPGVGEDTEDLKVSPTPSPVVIPTVEEQLKDSRYTEITTEAFEETVFNFQNELKKHGIELNSESVVRFVALTNLDHIQETNPEMLETIFGKNIDPQQAIGEQAGMISKIVDYNMKHEDKINYLDIFMDKKDREVAEEYDKALTEAEEYVTGTPIIENGTYATREEKSAYAEKLILEEFINKEFNKTTDVQTRPANFVTVAINTGRALGGPVSEYIVTPERRDELLVISKNKDNLSYLLVSIPTAVCDEPAKVLVK